MDKEDVVYIHNKILLSHQKNENLPFVKEWMDLKGIMLSEISDKYHMISLMYRIKKTKQLKQKHTQRRGTKNGCQKGVG